MFCDFGEITPVDEDGAMFHSDPLRSLSGIRILLPRINELQTADAS